MVIPFKQGATHLATSEVAVNHLIGCKCQACGAVTFSPAELRGYVEIGLCGSDNIG